MFYIYFNYILTGFAPETIDVGLDSHTMKSNKL